MEARLLAYGFKPSSRLPPLTRSGSSEVVADYSGATASDFHGLPSASTASITQSLNKAPPLRLDQKKASISPPWGHGGFRQYRQSVNVLLCGGPSDNRDEARLLTSGIQPTLCPSPNHGQNGKNRFRSRLQRRDRARFSRASVCFVTRAPAKRTTKKTLWHVVNRESINFTFFRTAHSDANLEQRRAIGTVAGG